MNKITTKCHVCGSTDVYQFEDSYICKNCMYDSLIDGTVMEGWNQVKPLVELLLDDCIKKGLMTVEAKEYMITKEWPGIYNWIREGISEIRKHGMVTTPDLNDEQIEIIKKILNADHK